MNLGEQLTELRNNILRDRSDIIAGDTDSLWTDETLLSYIKDAERRFARQTLILRDATTLAVCQIKIKTGVNMYPMHPSVLSVVSARFDTQEYDIRRTGRTLVQQQVQQESLNFDTPIVNTMPPGSPSAYYTDETMVYATQGRITVGIYPVPDADSNDKIIALRVIRLPIGGYTLDDLNRDSEIPEDYQLDVLEWAAYRAQRTFDGDAGSPTQANAHKDAFDEAVKNAIRELKRKMFANNGLRYGGNGFTWTR